MLVYSLVTLNSLDWLLTVELITPEFELNPIIRWIWVYLGCAGFIFVKLVVANMAIVLMGLLGYVKWLWFLNAFYLIVIMQHVIGAANAF